MRAHFDEIANQHHSAAKHSACESIWVAYCYNLDYEAQRKLVKCGMPLLLALYYIAIGMDRALILIINMNSP